MKHWPTWRCVECLNVHCSLGEMASDIGARPILGELLYVNQDLSRLYARLGLQQQIPYVSSGNVFFLMESSR